MQKRKEGRRATYLGMRNLSHTSNCTFVANKACTSTFAFPKEDKEIV